MFNAIRLKINALLSGRILRNLGWSATGFAASRGLSLASRLFLARLLTPDLFGLMAMVMMFLGIVNIFLDFGLRQSLIQRKREAVSSARYDSAFWFLIGSGIFWTIVISTFGAPMISLVFDEAQVEDLARVMAIGILFQAASVIPEVRLVRALRFKNLVIIENSSVALGLGIGVILALNGAGVWALAGQQISIFVSKATLHWVQMRWRPRYHFEFGLLRDVWRFSSFMLGSQSLHYIRLNFDNLAVGTLLGASALGTYSLAYLITETIRSQIGGVIAKVMFPVYSRASGDLEAMRSMHLSVVRYMCLVILPFATLLGLKAESILLVLFGPQWSDASSPTTILCFAAAVMALNGDPSSVLKGLGKGGLIFTLHAINTLLIGIPAIAFGAYYYGVEGAAYGVLFQAIIHFLMMFTAINRTLGTTASGLLKAASWGTFAAFAVATSNFLF